MARIRQRHGRLLVVHRLARDAEPAALLDPTGKTLARLGAEQAVYVIRPDGHIGYRNSGTDLPGVEHYLTRWLPGINT